jgi:hypothetical protein
MWKYEPSRDFVSRVMRSVHAYEASRVATLGFYDGTLGSRVVTFSLSWFAVLTGIFFSPAVCL